MQTKLEDLDYKSNTSWVILQKNRLEYFEKKGKRIMFVLFVFIGRKDKWMRAFLFMLLIGHL